MDNSVKSNTICPFCNYEFDRASALDDKEPKIPKKGDATICIKCANISIFDNSGQLHKPTKEDLDGFRKDRENWELLIRAQRELLLINAFMPDVHPN